MPALALILGMSVAAAIHRNLQTHAPSNMLVAHVRCQGPRVRIAVALLVLAAALMLGALALSEWAASGGPGWLHLVLITAIWDCLKFSVLAFAVLVRCAIATMRRVTARIRPAVEDACSA